MHSRPFPIGTGARSTCQPIWSYPKKQQPGKWRLIVDLSHSLCRSVNNDIPKPLCSLSYITVDSAITEL